MDQADLERRFTYHPPKSDQVPRYERLRAAGREFAELVNALCPDFGEKDVAIERVRDAVMWANAAIAVNE